MFYDERNSDCDDFSFLNIILEASTAALTAMKHCYEISIKKLDKYCNKII